MGKRAAAAMVGTTLTRQNWGSGENLARLAKARDDWDAKTGPHLEAEPTMPMTRYAVLVDIPYATLNKYCCKDLGKRQQLGVSVGTQPLFDSKEQQFAVDVIRRHDRGNDGLSRRECIDVLANLKPGVAGDAGALAGAPLAVAVTLEP